MEAERTRRNLPEGGRRLLPWFCVLGAGADMDQLQENSRLGAIVFAVLFVVSILVLLTDQAVAR